MKFFAAVAALSLGGTQGVLYIVCVCVCIRALMSTGLRRAHANKFFLPFPQPFSNKTTTAWELPSAPPCG